jgi:hypothetical protein
MACNQALNLSHWKSDMFTYDELVALTSKTNGILTEENLFAFVKEESQTELSTQQFREFGDSSKRTGNKKTST